MRSVLDVDPVVELFSGLRGSSVAVFPNTGNAGDGFIMYATLWMLRRFEVEYRLCGPDDVVSGKTVLFGGGGNLLEGVYATMADTIRRNFDRNRCILLPHTIHGYGDLAQLTTKGFEIYLREPRSYQSVLANGACVDRVHLGHDMTFYLPADIFGQIQSNGAGTLYCLRQDGERTDDETHPDNVDLSLAWNGRWWTNERLCKMSTLSLAAAISPFDRVVTDRLHIGILSAMLGKEVLLGANNYYKNKAVYEHSIQPHFGNVQFYDTRRELLTSAA